MLDEQDGHQKEYRGDEERQQRPEFHGFDNNGYPAGLAWVVAPPPGAKVDDEWAKIVFILVVDHERHKGIVTKLKGACRKRWPHAMETDWINEAGEALVRKPG